MSGAGAFNGDPALKAQALADLAANTHPGWNIMATPDDRKALASAYGLTPSLLSLIIMPQTPPASREVTVPQALSLVAPGADVDGIVRDWLLAVWRDRDFGPRDRLANTPAAAPAEAIIAAVSDPSLSLTGKEWRALRAALLRAEPLTLEQQGYAALVASMAWDPATATNLGGDVWVAWERAVNNERGCAQGWPQAKQDELMEALRDCHVRVASQTGGLRLGSTPEAMAQHQAAVDACMAEKGLAAPLKALLAIFEHESAFLLERGPKAFQTVLDACARGGVSQAS